MRSKSVCVCNAHFALAFRSRVSLCRFALAPRPALAPWCPAPAPRFHASLLGFRAKANARAQTRGNENARKRKRTKTKRLSAKRARMRLLLLFARCTGSGKLPTSEKLPYVGKKMPRKNEKSSKNVPSTHCADLVGPNSANLRAQSSQKTRKINATPTDFSAF